MHTNQTCREEWWVIFRQACPVSTVTAIHMSLRWIVPLQLRRLWTILGQVCWQYLSSSEGGHTQGFSYQRNMEGGAKNKWKNGIQIQNGWSIVWECGRKPTQKHSYLNDCKHYCATLSRCCKEFVTKSMHAASKTELQFSHCAVCLHMWISECA